MAETITTTTPVVLHVPTSVKALIEALIFGAREALSVRQIQALYEEPGTSGGEPRKIDYEEINRSVEELNGEYTSSDRPYRIIQIAGGYQFATLPLYAEWLGKLYKEQTRRKLSQSSIETLAIIAYKQPITKPEIESIRGVNCDYVLSTLLEKDLATIVGRASTVGRPLLYGTSTEFLKHFGLNDLNDLPRPREIQEILGDSQFETERRMLEAQQGVEEKKEEEFKSRLPHIPKRKAGLDDDVKIFQKKRTRDIKLRTPDESEVEKPAERSVVQPTEEILASPAAGVIDELAVSTSESELTTALDIPTIENVDETPTVEQVAAEPETEEATETPVPMKYFEMPVTAAPESLKEDEIPQEATEEVVLQVVAQTTDAPAAIVPEESSDLTSEQPEIASIQVEEDVAKIGEESELQVFEAPIVQDELKTVPVEPEEIVSEQVPQSFTPTPEEHNEVVIAAEPEMPAEESHASSDVSQPKTRWKSWKEKIQGFIKKLFG